MQAWIRRGLVTLVLSLFAGGAMAQPAPVSYHLETLAGGDFAGDGGSSTLALLVQTEGVASDSKGNLYIADAGDHRVRKVAANGIISTVAGNGRPGYSGDGGPAAAAQLRTPYGLAVDRIGNLYIADLGNGRIRRVSPGGIITTVAGGGTSIAADGRSATDAALNNPRNVAVDYYGVLYFSDFGSHRVFQLREGGTLAVVAGTGQPGLSGDNGPAVKAQLNAPAGLAVDAWGNVLIADSANGRIRKVWRGVITTLGDSGGTVGSIPVRTPAGLALDPDGSLFVADIGGNQILRITPELTFTPIAQPARDLAIDAQGNLYTCSGPLVYRRPRFGETVLVAGSLAANYTGDGTAPERARFQDPGALARDSAGNLYVADTGSHRVRKITADGAVFTVAGNGLRGFGGDAGPALGAQLNSPSGVAIDLAGNLYISDTGNHRVRKVDPAGTIVTIAGSGTRGHSPDSMEAVRANLDTPTWLAVDRDGTVYVTESGANAVRKITAAGLLGTAAGNGLRGYSGDGGPSVLASLDSPQGIALDADGNLFIADAGNRRIRRVAAARDYGPTLISTVPDEYAAIWRALRGIAAAKDGRLYVTDAEDARVFRVDGPGNLMTLAGTGVSSYTGDSGPALQQALNIPTGIVVDNAGTVYLADTGNARIRKLTPIIDTVAPPPSLGSGITIVSAASWLPGPIAPGELVSILGSGLGPAEAVSAVEPVSELGGTTVLVNGRAAPLSFVSPGQINLQIPYSLAAPGDAGVQVVSGGVVRASATAPVFESAPALFTVSGGSGPAAALNEDGSVNTEDNPAARGSIIVLFGTGEGKTNPTTVLGVTVKIGGYPAEVLFAGPAPGFAGLLQVNVRIPTGFLPPGRQPVTLIVGPSASQSGVTIFLL